MKDLYSTSLRGDTETSASDQGEDDPEPRAATDLYPAVSSTTFAPPKGPSDISRSKNESPARALNIDDFVKHICTAQERGRLSVRSLDTMGRHFGDLAKLRHIITYSISPFEQRAFPNYFSKGVPNVWRRFTASIFKIAPRKCPSISIFKCMHAEQK
ncbi:hypothetical protein SRHO_G00123710 [Serrasalmus rhombeus]